MTMTKKKFRFNRNKLNYDFYLKKRFPWWWLLLFLLPLLLLIPIDKDFSVVTLDEMEEIIPGAKVELSYVDCFIYRDGIWFGNKVFESSRITDSDGYANFGLIHGSVYGFLFHHFSKINLSATSGSRKGTKRLYYYSVFRNPVPIILDRGEFKIQVKRLDTEAPINGACLRLDFQNLGAMNLTTDADGMATFYVTPEMGAISQLLSSHPGFVDSKLHDITIDDYLDRILVVWMYYEIDNVDIVLCIDGTGSMGGALDAVKSSSKTIYNKLKTNCENHGKIVNKMRLRLVYFGDFGVDGNKALIASRFFNMPGEERDYNSTVNGLSLCAGGDADESGLEALAVAMNSEWANDYGRYRRLIALWSDAAAHPLHTVGISNPIYPTDIPKTFSELKNRWKSISLDETNNRISRLLLVTPDISPWKDIRNGWDGVQFKEYDASTVDNVDSMLDDISIAM